MIKYACFLALGFFLLISNQSFGQNLFQTNLRDIKVDQLTDNDIMKYMQQLKTSGVSQSQAEQIAISKGMPVSEIQKLRQRVAQLNANPQNNLQQNKQGQNNLNQTQIQTGIDTTQQPIDTTTKILKPLINPKIFGSELFNNASLTFEPNLQIATPVNYILGPADALNISIYGLQEFSNVLNVTPEGTLAIPEVGQIKVAGLTIEEAQQKIFNAMSSSVYSTLKNGRSKLSVTLSTIRSIKVTVIGANKPGNYTFITYHCI